MDLYTLSGFTGAVSLAGSTIGSSSALKVKFANATQYAINGKGTSVSAATETVLSGTTLAGTTANEGQSCLFLITGNSAGVAVATQGPIVDNVNITSGSEALVLPPVPEDQCPLFYAQISTSNAASFIPGTTALSATGVYDGYQDLIGGITDRGVTTVLAV